MCAEGPWFAPGYGRGDGLKLYCYSGVSEYIYSFQELCTEPCDMEPYIIMLRDEVMVDRKSVV